MTLRTLACRSPRFKIFIVDFADGSRLFAFFQGGSQVILVTL